MKVALITLSDRASEGLYEDLSTPKLEKWLVNHGVTHLTKELISDDRNQLMNSLGILLNQDFAIVLTCGGTGISSRDITPDVTKEIIDKEIPGITDLIRSQNTHPMSALSRAICGSAKKTLILNLSGSPQGAVEQLEVAWPVLLHACAILKGDRISGSSCD
jgi:molybdopterin adenylyltransferase